MKKYLLKFLPRVSRKRSSSELRVASEERSPTSSIDYCIDANGQRVSADDHTRQLSPHMHKRKDSKDVAMLKKDSRARLSLSEEESPIIPQKISTELSSLTLEMKALRGQNQELASTVNALQRDLSALLARLVEQESSPPKPPKPQSIKSEGTAEGKL